MRATRRLRIGERERPPLPAATRQFIAAAVRHLGCGRSVLGEGKRAGS